MLGLLFEASSPLGLDSVTCGLPFEGEGRDHLPRMRRDLPSLCLIALLTAACADIDEEPCGPGTVQEGSRCVDPTARYEPDARVDQDNVVAFGDPLTELHLPDPPRSGFRIIAPPRDMEPGEEVETCLSWPFPKIKNTLVYAARIYATPGLHHANTIAKPVNQDLGPNPYPDCHPGADDPFGQLPAVIPDVLFASSTQVTGREDLDFEPGQAFRIDPTREIASNYHLLNTADHSQRVEVAYDFFTMPDDLLENEVTAFVMEVDDFLVPPHDTQEIGSTCRAFGGTVVSLMPHYHKYTESFVTDVVPLKGDATNIYEDTGFDAASDIRMYSPPLQLGDFDSFRFGCQVRNTTDHDMHFGNGENEMCVLFGYLYPVEKQFIGHSTFQGEPCKSFQIGLFR